MQPIAMEDNFADVVRKAQRGLGLSDRGLAARATISEEALTRIKAEHYDAEGLRKLAPVLGLSPRALAALPDYRPAPVTLARLAGFSTVYGGMRVNAYLAWDAPGGHAAVFDTGTDCTGILEALRSKNLTLCGIFITHTHGDHIEALDRLRNETGATVFVSNREPLRGAEVFEAGREIACGRLRIETRLTWGHSRGGTTYVIRGLERPVAVVGDALFAGSMGGGLVSYADALRTNRKEILALPPETVICPGHGPLTTVAEEQIHNPFFA
ncbi:MAG: MBL fold metallo-hydrolase [Chthoniobacteraceae bacterium]|nr:MBL fold metallo-hydrolase [Chthoniobacteraceae bacterium]